ncbi:hypothetical protein AAG565_13075 [Fontimonas sp. SYSU GA230001]|uniref:hypothetical protein n=1 Tax=Fontimonas sp. SYSU GA230001 TaxID=3142450 RepID=UPI0032B5ACFE
MAQAQDPYQALLAELGGDPLPGLDRLEPAELQALTAALRKARRRQQDLLAGALEGALSHVPLLLRGPVRKILVPS